ncbi:MAG: AraC family transcriptional regulator [Ketobacteraceae bacterium]|nr:AraC family transcriptional regulator [Ketobacteraceae bacterium]
MLINPKEPILLVHHYPRALVSLMGEYGVPLETMLEGSQVDPGVFTDRNSTISYAQYGVLILNALRHFPGESLGLAFGKYLHITQHGMLGVAVMTAATLRDAIHIMEKYYRLLSPIVTIRSQQNGDECIVKAEESWNMGPLQVLAMETFFSGIYENCGFILGELPPAQFYFRHSAPYYAAQYRTVFGDKCHFDCAADQIVLERHWLDRPLRFANPVTCEQALGFCDQQLERIIGHESLLVKLKNLPVVMEGKTLPLDEAARALNMSGRSLRRHLQELNTSYQQVTDRLKAELAEQLLRDSDRPVADIAEQLGFGDVANFRKAFKRWLGKTPSEYRKGLLNPQA